MPADLNKPFGESCCDGGECSVNDMSAQSCGCDKGANWVCVYHKMQATMKQAMDELQDKMDKETYGQIKDTP